MKWVIDNKTFIVLYIDIYQYGLWCDHKEIFDKTRVFQQEYWNHRDKTFCFPLNDKFKTLADNYVVDVPPDATLLFDKSSMYPRYKLSLTKHKRCIKTTKADYIVVGTKGTPRINNVHVYQYSDTHIILIDDYTLRRIGNNVSKLPHYIKSIYNIDIKLMYSGQAIIVDKHCEYIYDYCFGNYTQKFITDDNLDNTINNILVEPQFEELLAIANLLDSPDPETRKMGAKMLIVYNSTKYRLSLSLVLAYPNRIIENEINDVATAQLINTLQLSKYMFRNVTNLETKLRYCYRSNVEYCVEDIAIAKELIKVLIDRDVQARIKDLKNKYNELIPDVEVVCR